MSKADNKIILEWLPKGELSAPTRANHDRLAEVTYDREGEVGMGLANVVHAVQLSQTAGAEALAGVERVAAHAIRTPATASSHSSELSAGDAAKIEIDHSAVIAAANQHARPAIEVLQEMERFGTEPKQQSPKPIAGSAHVAPKLKTSIMQKQIAMPEPDGTSASTFAPKDNDPAAANIARIKLADVFGDIQSPNIHNENRASTPVQPAESEGLSSLDYFEPLSSEPTDREPEYV